MAFTGCRQNQHVPCRLIVRRVKRPQPLATDGTKQRELFATYRHHAFITNSTLSMVEADQRHRDHALVEQVIAESKYGPLAHLPSGKYTANAAWVAAAVIAFNIARATAVASSMQTARWATVRTRLINIPARIATTGRRLVLHLPTRWPWARGWELLWSTATSPPAPEHGLTTPRRRRHDPRTRRRRAGTSRQFSHAQRHEPLAIDRNHRPQINRGGSGLRPRRP
ncbi:transposase [Nocardioides convexus]|uniref:transposase n=1 Tax=Nocardioides convexus TaxID=2712224 RepID=UPI00241883A0|nr:transposase [Nocardioides convexus]